MDEHWEKRGTLETPSLKQRPSDCVREHPIFFSFEADESFLPETFRYLGESHFVYATDIPTGIASSRPICAIPRALGCLREDQKQASVRECQGSLRDLAACFTNGLT